MAKAAGQMRMMDRLAARRAGWQRIYTRFTLAPVPHTIGSPLRGQQLVKGDLLFAGHPVHDPDRMIWDAAGGDPAIDAALHSCLWLDDLAACGTPAAQTRAQDWVFAWITRFDRGKGSGWAPAVTGRRVSRWINHAEFLLTGRSPADFDRFFASLARQCWFLSRRAASAPQGLPRFTALAGTVHAALSLDGLADLATPAIAALSRACDADIGPDGSIASRNPEQLADLLSILNWTATVMAEARTDPPAPLLAAIARITPTLRGLRHVDGALARFHGGGRGGEGQLDAALAATGVKTLPDDTPQMGFLRLRAGRSSLIVDAAPPPAGPDGHASTLAFELTSGRRPLIVSCGAGTRFGTDWRKTARSTASHSTAEIGDAPSALLPDGAEGLRTAPSQVQCLPAATAEGHQVELSHDGYRSRFGLTHGRVLTLSRDGRHLSGSDILTTLDDADAARFDSASASPPLPGVAFAIRFHLHPDVKATVDTGKQSARLSLPSGESWVLDCNDAVEMAILPSVYLENGPLLPRPAQQVVLSGRTMAYATRVRWSLAKTPDTPDAIRDLVQSEPVVAVEDTL